MPVTIDATVLGSELALPGGLQYSFINNVDNNPNTFNYRDQQGSRKKIDLIFPTIKNHISN